MFVVCFALEYSDFALHCQPVFTAHQACATSPVALDHVAAFIARLACQSSINRPNADVITLVPPVGPSVNDAMQADMQEVKKTLMQNQKQLAMYPVDDLQAVLTSPTMQTAYKMENLESQRLWSMHGLQTSMSPSSKRNAYKR